MGSHTFTRQELYDLVWAEPMTKAAKRFGISDQGLAKACDRAGVPAPPRGYWAKLAAGHKVPKTPLPPTGKGMLAQVIINPPSQRPKPPPPPPPAPSVAAKMEEEQRPEARIKVPATLSNPHRIVAAMLEQDARDWARSKTDPWRRGRFEAIDGTPLKKRRLRIMSTLFKALEERGYKLSTEGQYYFRSQLEWQHDKVPISVRADIREGRRKLTAEDRANNPNLPRRQIWTKDKHTIEEVVVTLGEGRSYARAPTWTDEPDAPLEGRINEVLGGVAAAFEERRLERIRQAERAAEQQQREHQRYLREQERKRETIRFRRLVAATDNLKTAEHIRELVSIVEASSRATDDPEGFARWKEWALAHADRIDPLRKESLFSFTVSDTELWSLKD